MTVPIAMVRAFPLGFGPREDDYSRGIKAGFTGQQVG